MIRAVIFDLDGVLVETDGFHYESWRRMAKEQGLPFDPAISERLLGLSRMDSLDIVLEKADRAYTEAEKLALAMRKNDIYMEMTASLSDKDVKPGVKELMRDLRGKGCRLAVGSSSKNAGYILRKVGLYPLFDAVADGGDVEKGKPDPEVFRLAAKLLETPWEECLVVENAPCGIAAAKALSMPVLALGESKEDKRADYRADKLIDSDILTLFE